MRAHVVSTHEEPGGGIRYNVALSHWHIRVRVAYRAHGGY